MSGPLLPDRWPATMGVVLAGGLGRRMGGVHKPLLEIGGRTLLDRAASRLAPQCEGVIVSVHERGDPFHGTGLPVVADSVPGRLGPLAGILSALEWAASHRPFLEWVVSSPGDTPFLPRDLVPGLHRARVAARASLAHAVSGERSHPAIGLWPVALRHDLRAAMVNEDVRSVRLWAQGHGAARASWPTEPFDPFFNVNTAEDLAEARALAIHETSDARR